MDQASSGIITRLTELLGPRGVISSDAEMAAFLVDERQLYRGTAACVVQPSSTEQVCAIVRLCRTENYAIVPQGGNTGYCGGATPDSDRQILLSLSRLNQIREVDPIGFTATVEAGVILTQLHEATADHDLFFPLSMGSEGSCQLGGNLSTNAGGLAVLRYGTARELCLGLEVVLPDGEILNLLSPLRKDNTGYDLKSLFMGAEGTLGIITAAVVKLFPAPTEQQTAWLAVSNPASACKLLAMARKLSGDTVTSFEYISQASLDLVAQHIQSVHLPFTYAAPHQVLLELSGPLPSGALRQRLEAILEQAMSEGLVEDGVLADSGTQRKQLWRLRESIPEAEKKAGRSVKHDISVAIASVPEYLTQASGRLQQLPLHRSSIYGHIGDGNLHYNILAPQGDNADEFRAKHANAASNALHVLAAEMGGSFSAEHGIGKLKKNELARFKDARALQLMRDIKHLLDPDDLMNPGKLF
jgi:FAD/FMN-containing dehydrogenase